MISGRHKIKVPYVIILSLIILNGCGGLDSLGGKDDALFAAIKNNDTVKAKALIDKKANVNARDAYGATPLMIVTGLTKNIDLMKYLIEHGADVNAIDPSGNTSLSGNIWSKHNFEITKYLVEHGANINTRNKLGKTPLGLPPLVVPLLKTEQPRFPATLAQ
jgi:ankyrin repeat protein